LTLGLPIVLGRADYADAGRVGCAGGQGPALAKKFLLDRKEPKRPENPGLAQAEELSPLRPAGLG
jgi:hypothetical protein